MKKTMFSLLMLAAMFMIASCGSKSNSGEATEATQEQVKEVTFTDPAITYNEGLDLTSYFSAESLTKPGIWQSNDGDYYLSTNVKLKVVKKLNVVKGERDYGGSSITFVIKFCDENGSTIDKGSETYYFDKIENLSEGTVITLDIRSRGHEGWEDRMKEKLDKVAKIEISISSDNLKFAETAGSNE